ncbi:Hsp70 family protein, partial [Priestia sp. SIMBA_032]|uniref:Hsp70 family protein n=1 Tax=Priestia sp. SIMBA_032 TaxID=3085775 RepID=UPI003978F787
MEQLDAKALASLEDAVEQLKRQLFEGPRSLSWEHAGRRLEWRLDSELAQRIWAPLLLRLRAPLEQALRDARLRPQELDNLVLVGGATRLPAVQKMVAALFGRLPYRHLD